MVKKILLAAAVFGAPALFAAEETAPVAETAAAEVAPTTDAAEAAPAEAAQ